MSDHFDEFSKSLAEDSIPRRQSLRLLGAAVAGALLSPWGPRSAWAAGDACKKYCNRYPKSHRSACLTACQACSGNTSRLCGSGSSIACCTSGTTCCDGYCADLADNFVHCGACGAACEYPGPYEDGACVDGQCVYWCADGATDCGGTCTDLNADPNNCGACGNVCNGSTPNCGSGTCDHCPPGYADCYGTGGCVNLSFDSGNCGACGVVCDHTFETCLAGSCVPTEPPPPGEW